MLEWLIPAVIGGVTSLVGSAANAKSQTDTNNMNYEINERNIEYNTAMTQQQWERDDNAHQREVADLKAAGLSPLATTNGANTSAALGAPNPIAMQAPHIDLNQLMNTALQAKALNETERHNRVQEGQKDIELSQKADEIQNKVDQIKLDNEKLQHQIEYDAAYLSKLSSQIEETERSNKKQEELKKLQIENETYLKQIQQQTGNKTNYKIYKNYNEYKSALSSWETEFDIFITKFISETSESTSNSQSENWNGQASVNAGKLAGASGGIGEGSSSSGSYSYNVSKQQEAQIEKFYRSHPMPVYIYEF